MEIIGKKIKLRPFKESDIDDVIHWMLVETEWQNWDAPWEDSSGFDQDAYRKRILKDLRDHSKPSFYGRLEIEVIETGEHIGSVNSYYIDNDFNYTRGGGNFTIGIDDNRSTAQGMGEHRDQCDGIELRCEYGATS